MAVPWEFARRAYDLDVRNATLLTTDLEDGCADAVVMLHVIEHLDDPADNLRAVTRILRDDGILVVETPIYQNSDISHSRKKRAELEL